MSKHRALLVGINYVGTSNELRGCVNDVNTMKTILETHYGFNDPTNVKMLTDSKATKRNIVSGLEWLVEGAAPGDVLFFHYSGHGSQVPDGSDGDHEPDGLDEIICPVDIDWNMNIIRDDQMKQIFDKIPSGCNLTVILDCCHSGGGLDHDNQYQPYGVGVAKSTPRSKIIPRNRFMPMPANLYSQAMSRTRKKKLKVKKKTMLAKSIQKNGLLITGCQSQQTSADAWIGGKFMGAATYFIADTLKRYEYVVSYKSLVEEIGKRLADNNFTQCPELNGSKLLFNNNFLSEFETTEESPTETLPAVPLLVEEKQSFWNSVKSFFASLFGKIFGAK